MPERVAARGGGAAPVPRGAAVPAGGAGRGRLGGTSGTGPGRAARRATRAGNSSRHRSARAWSIEVPPLPQFWASGEVAMIGAERRGCKALRAEFAAISGGFDLAEISANLLPRRQRRQGAQRLSKALH